MNWKKFFACLTLLSCGLAALAGFSLGILWVIETLGVWAFIGGSFGLLIIGISATFGLTEDIE